MPELVANSIGPCSANADPELAPSGCHMWWLPDRSPLEMHRSEASLRGLLQRPDEPGLLPDQRREHSRSFPRTHRLHIWSHSKRYFESVPRTFAERPKSGCFGRSSAVVSPGRIQGITDGGVTCGWEAPAWPGLRLVSASDLPWNRDPVLPGSRGSYATALLFAITTARTVDACHLVPPWAVGTLSSFSARAMADQPSPARDASTIRETTSPGSTLGRPRRTPWARFTARASFVRWPMIRRSHWAALAMTPAMNSPDGVDRSTPRSRATRFH